jgi:hypothetical protein
VDLLEANFEVRLWILFLKMNFHDWQHEHSGQHIDKVLKLQGSPINMQEPLQL